jgi:hypothetical protein
LRVRRGEVSGEMQVNASEIQVNAGKMQVIDAEMKGKCR